MSHRVERVRDLLMEAGSEILRTVKDPALGSELITITDVKLTPDLGMARFYVSVLADPDRQAEVLEGLGRASGYFRHQLRHAVHLRRIPDVRFEADHTLEQAARLMQVIERAHPAEAPTAEGPSE